MRQRAPLLLVWPDPSRGRSAAPLRLLDAPGPAYLRQNQSTLLTEPPPGPERLARLVDAGPSQVWCLFDLASRDAAVAVARTLDAAGVEVIAARGRLLGTADLTHFSAANLAPDLASALPVTPGPAWVHPVLVAESRDLVGDTERLAVVCTRHPDPGLLTLADVGRAGCDEGAVAGAIERDTTLDELDALLAAHDRLGLSRVLLVDNGGDVDVLADALASRGRLRACFGAARRAVPRAALRVGASVHRWFERDDEGAALPATGCAVTAWVPAGFEGEDIAGATARMLDLRARGVTRVVPRFEVPTPNTRAWEALASRYTPRPLRAEALDGTHVVFPVPGYERVVGPELLELWARDAVAPPTARRGSLAAVDAAIARFREDLRAGHEAPHARALLDDLRAVLSSQSLHLEPMERYPFARWDGEDLVTRIDRALDARLRSLDGAPDALLRAMQRAVLTGGKRIRAVIAVVIGAAHGLPADAAVSVALVPEMLHAASLVQDDLPCMDDDAVRRAESSVHAGHGEGVALLASDALVAMAFEDLAALAEHPAVGPARAVRMVRALARAMGVQGLVGGQALDLALRDGRPSDLTSMLAIHAGKTAPLFAVSASLPAIAVGVGDSEVARLASAVEPLGVAFQIVDDALDADPASPASGRMGGSDARQRRANAATLLGREAARERARALVAPLVHASEEVVALRPLALLARFVVERGR